MNLLERYEKETGKEAVFYRDGNGIYTDSFEQWKAGEIFRLESSLSKLTEENATLRAENERLRKDLAIAISDRDAWKTSFVNEHPEAFQKGLL